MRSLPGVLSLCAVGCAGLPQVPAGEPHGNLQVRVVHPVPNRMYQDFVTLDSHDEPSPCRTTPPVASRGRASACSPSIAESWLPSGPSAWAKRLSSHARAATSLGPATRRASNRCARLRPNREPALLADTPDEEPCAANLTLLASWR